MVMTMNYNESGLDYKSFRVTERKRQRHIGRKDVMRIERYDEGEE